MFFKYKMNLFVIYIELYNELRKHNIKFNRSGFPIFKKSFFVNKPPLEIIPFKNRLKCHDKSKTALCTFCNDKFIYPRLKKLKQDISIYKEFYALVVFDLSPCVEWKSEQQFFNICLNQMAAIYLAIHGVKLIGNFRTGDFTTFKALYSYPNGIPFAVGTLGCTKKRNEIDIISFEQKVLIKQPKECYLYGAEDTSTINVLKDYDIEYKVFEDYRKKSYAISRGSF